MAATQRRVVRSTVVAAVPLSVFGASSLYGRHTAAPAVQDFLETCGEDWRESITVQNLRIYFSGPQIQKLCVIKDSSAPDFYEEVFTEAGMGHQAGNRWCIYQMYRMCLRFHLLQEYLRFIRECPSLASDMRQNVEDDIVQKLNKTMRAMERELTVHHCRKS